MDRVAVFVDAGYLFAQGSFVLAGKKTQRGDLKVDFAKTLDALEQFATSVSKLPLLRIYWYDGTATGPSPQHLTLAFENRVKLRLGFVNTAGQQKGVDSLIVTDMITLARNRSMCEAVLLSGDEDLRVGVQQAQEFGVRVHLLGITPCRGSQSLFLLQEADTTHEWDKADVSNFLSYTPRPAAPTFAAPVVTVAPAAPVAVVATPASVKTLADLAVAPAAFAAVVATPTSIRTLADLAKEAAAEVDPAVLDGLVKNFDVTGQLPPEIDRPLIGRAGKSMGRLDHAQLRDLRNLFAAAMKARLPSK